MSTSRGRRTQRRNAERTAYNAEQARLREIQRSFKPKRKKIKEAS